MPIFSTGQTELPDIGTLSYQNVSFSSLFKSEASCVDVPDAAGRTTKLVEISLRVEGFVTLLPGDATTDNTMDRILTLLSQPGGVLIYQGKGLGNVTVNAPGGALKDVAWGPVPKVLDFKPLGGSRSAMVSWEVTARVPKFPPRPAGQGKADLLSGIGGPGATGPVLQWNYEASISYDDECYSTVSIRGTLEVPLTRRSPTDRTVAQTVDDYRQRWLDISIDLTRFRVTKRSFGHSRDKRTCEWEYVAEELPPMGLPPGVASARGRYDVQSGGMGLVRWLARLNCTYTVRKDAPRQAAWGAFVSLLKFRMEQSALGNIPLISDNSAAGQAPPPPPVPVVVAQGLLKGSLGLTSLYKSILARQQQRGGGIAAALKRKAWLMEFSFSEGLYLDSKTTTFNASWKLITTFSHVLLASGLWRWDPDSLGGNLWAISMKDVSGWHGVLENRLDPRADAIVDFGSG